VLRLFAYVAVVIAALSLSAPGAMALTVTNEGEETVHVWIESWMYRLRSGRTVTFIPTVEPARIVLETRHTRIECEAGAESEVLVSADKCFVDGVDAGSSRMHL
jgi:hypothetical protein